ncbi:SpoIIIAH-like family protein [Maledivibacter halophilus]|uniref:Stage III sporulation protein AH n=1 Tax=Maledivibacter halophilus TaxID=36842 RepID=A0A1T5L8F8_9FIRM|nr:SpoIIIAH-like family protein [Maledivibacter halophilus]SKC72233.1 stage III sporulation protein AH [Maledivibacter halophilus]
MFNFKFEKRKLIVLSLVFVLISISYLNYMINKRSLMEISTDLREYEEKQMSEMSEDASYDDESFKDTITHEVPFDGETATSSITTIEDGNNIIDSSKNDVEDIIAVSNTNIENSLESNNLNDSNYFLQAKIDIEMEREKTIERFEEIIDNDKVDEESRKNAVNKKLKLVEIMNKEKVVESLIKTKGFEDSVVFITDENIYVTVQTDKLKKSDLAKVLDIVTRETQYSIDNIIVQNK